MIRKALFTALLVTSTSAHAQFCVSLPAGPLTVDPVKGTIRQGNITINAICGPVLAGEATWKGGLICSEETIFVRGADGRMFPCWVTGL